MTRSRHVFDGLDAHLAVIYDPGNERKFLNGVAGAFSPGWTVRLGDHLSPGNTRLAEHTVFIYPVETSSGWLCAGSATVASMHQLVAMKATAPESMSAKTIVAAAVQTIQDCAKHNRPADSAEMHDALTMTMLALTETRTFQLAQQTPTGVSGHWLYLLYRMHDGSQVARPCCIKLPTTGFLPPGDLDGHIRTVIGMDLANQASFIHSQIKAGGGLVLAERFRK